MQWLTSPAHVSEAEWCGRKRSPWAEGDYLGRPGNQAGAQTWDPGYTRALMLTHTGKQQGNDQYWKKQIVYVREALRETGSIISWYQARKRKIQHVCTHLFSLKFIKMSVYRAQHCASEKWDAATPLCVWAPQSSARPRYQPDPARGRGAFSNVYPEEDSFFPP